MPAKNKTNRGLASRRRGKFDDYLFSIYILYFSADNLSTLEADFPLKTDFHGLADLKRRPRFRRIAKSRAVKLLIMRFCRYSRILVVIKSTPSEISFSASARSFTVQQLILIPRRLSSATFSSFKEG